MNRCISRKDYLKKDNSNVGYALYVQDNIKKDDYARLNTGQIVKIIGIKENKVDKKAIYFNIYNEDWCNSAAVENFSENIIDLIEVGDYVNGYPVRRIPNFNNELCNFDLNNMEWTPLKEIDVYYNILTKELYQANCYTVERKEDGK